MSSSPCPEPGALSEYLAGRLDPETASFVRVHLLVCDACSRLVGDLSAPLDKTLAFDSRAASQTQPEDESPPDRIDDILGLHFLHPSPDPRALGRVGTNDVLGVLGRGAMGVVLKAFDTSLCRNVAIKVLSPALAASPKALERFKREARAAASINHPNIVTVHAVDDHASLPYIVMEYVSGMTLRQRIKSGQRFDLTSVLRIGAQIATGLAAAHEHGVIHRDIKPANIMLEDNVERVKITDFGLALVLMDASKITSVGLVVGTPAYMSPEQIDGGLIDTRSDLFSLGCVFHAIITGKSPFAAMHPIEVARRLREYHPPPLSQDYPEIPAYFSDLVCGLLEKSPEDRPASAEEVGKLLTAHLAAANLGNQASISFAPLRRRDPPKKLRRPPLAFLAMMAVLAVALFAAWWFWPGKSTLGQDGALTVGEAGRYRTLLDALEDARPGSTIRILDDRTYQGPIVLADDERFHGLTIESTRGATLENRASKKPILSIDNTPGVCLRGLRLKARDHQHAVSVRGQCDGLTMEGLQVTQPKESPLAAIVCWHGTTGTAERPIRLIGSEIRCGDIGFVVDGRPHAPSCWIQVDRCRFQGSGVFVVFEDSAQEIRVTRNVFFKGAAGVGLNMKSAKSFRGVLVANNTFYQSTTWLNLSKSTLDQQDVRVERNLIVQADQTTSPEDLAGIGWFRDNWWEPPAGADLVEVRKVAEVKQELPLLSRDPAHEDFLKPAPGAMALPAGDNEFPYIGALPPAEGARH